jgi:CRISPR-associated protein Cas1
MSGEDHPWQIVAGFGAHIRATATRLSIMHKGRTREYPLHTVRHLLVVGGHTLHTSALTHLLRAGASVSFFDADGTPLSVLRPFGAREDETMRTIQHAASPHHYALALTRASIRARLMFIEKTAVSLGRDLFYEGERDLLIQNLDELEYLVKMDELRRVHKLETDMYYEIMARTIPAELGFRRRSGRPHRDPVNAMLSLGYAMLFGNCCVSIIGAHLDPDGGMLHKGERSLVLDLIDALKPAMVDEAVFALARSGLDQDEYDCSTSRCHLDPAVIRRLTEAVRQSLDQGLIDENVAVFRRALLKNGEFQIVY